MWRRPELILIASLSVIALPQARSAPPPPLSAIANNPSTRLLVVAPHPDDEVLAAGGLIHHVASSGGQVRIVYLTDGDGFPRGVAVQEHEQKPEDYREYGREREKEARRAIEALGLRENAAIFLGFPDAGLCQLLTTAYWSDRGATYQSPYSRRDRPRDSQKIDSDAKFHGEDLTEEFAKVIGRFRPTVILTPRREDQHADHCAAPFLVDDAIESVRRVNPSTSIDVVNYIVHHNDWPEPDSSSRLKPPRGLSSGRSGWMSLPLTPGDRAAKRAALGHYKTQLKVMRDFLEEFLAANEVFSRPSRRAAALPMSRSPCCDE